MNKEIKIFTGNAASRKRSRILSTLLEKTTLAFFKNTAIRKGMNGLDMNCGEGAITFHLADMVGATGSMTGIDRNSTNIEISKQKATVRKRDNIVWENSSNYGENQNYDFVYARFLLSNSKNPMEQVAQMYQLLKPGGLLIIEEMDFTKYRCFPSCFAFTRYIELFSAIADRNGNDPTIGSKLNAICREANFQHVITMQIPPIFLNKEAKGIGSLTLESITEEVLKEHLVVPAELNALIAELKAFEKEADTMISLPGIYQMQAQRN